MIIIDTFNSIQYYYFEFFGYINIYDDLPVICEDRISAGLFLDDDDKGLCAANYRPHIQHTIQAVCNA